MVKFAQIKNDINIRTYIEHADNALKGIGYTEHSFAHLGLCAERTGWILSELDYDARTVELGQIAAFMHDIGNVVNRNGHAHHGAILSFSLLSNIGMPSDEIAQVVTAIGYHDEATANAITPINSALIIADKSDVRWTRVRDKNPSNHDYHDQVNFAVKKAELEMNKQEKTITLKLKVDTNLSSVASYFDLFLNRMLLSRKAAEFLGLEFKLNINGAILL